MKKNFKIMITYGVFNNGVFDIRQDIDDNN